MKINNRYSNILDFFISIPNYPLYFLVSIYITLKIIKEVGIEKYVIEDSNNDLENSMLEKIYPNWFENSIAICFYLLIILKLIN